MLDFGERGEMFYDSLDMLSSLDDDSATGLWRNEFTAVEDRRKAFLSKLGESLGMEVDRVSEISEAVSISCYSSSLSNETVEFPVDGERGDFGEANDMSDEPETDLSVELIMDHTLDQTMSVSSDDPRKLGLDMKVRRHWWKKLLSLARKRSTNSKAPGISRINKVQAIKKRQKELSALYTSQEFRAHEGVVWTAKFSADGQYLATGGQDGVVRVWRVTSADSLEKHFLDQDDINGQCVPVFVPDQVFQINETPIHEFHGHGGDILDLAWSNSNLILSSSTDNTVRLWQVGSDECLSIFHHPDFVTCVQFNPINDDYFVTGSIDGKIRIWGVVEGRVTDWDDAREALTAVSYQPNGQGVVAGLLNGTCRFYEASDSALQLSAHVSIPGSKRSSGSRITGIQFCQENPERVIVTSEDSKIRVFDKTNVIKKYRGLPKSGTQTSASFTASGKHILSVGEDSRVYLWDYNGEDKTPPSKHTKSSHSCEYFYSQGVSVALPWGGNESAKRVSSSGCANQSCFEVAGHQEPECISLAKWFSMEGSSRVTATWPEEMLSLRDLCDCDGVKSPTWGLVIVTASCDGMIRVFHNYGLLPIKA